MMIFIINSCLKECGWSGSCEGCHKYVVCFVLGPLEDLYSSFARLNEQEMVGTRHLSSTDISCESDLHLGT